MTIAIQKGRAIVLVLLMAVAMLFSTGVSTSILPRAHAHNWTRIENYAWQGGNFACHAVTVIGPYWGAASYANWNLWRINSNWTRQDLSIVLALGAAQQCPEHFWIFAYQIPPEIAQRIAPPPPPAPAPPALP